MVADWVRNQSRDLADDVAVVYRDEGHSARTDDRPTFQQMIADARAGRLDAIVVHKFDLLARDRLYRGIRAMLLVLETIQEHNLQVLLARETFDQKLAPLKARVAQMELEGMRERMTMGVEAHLRAGKANTGQDRYGYKRVGEVIEIVEEAGKSSRFLYRPSLTWKPAGRSRKYARPTKHTPPTT